MFIGKQNWDYEPCLLANNAVFTNAIANIMNHVYWQTRAVFTNVIDNIMNHVKLANKGGIFKYN